MKIFPQNLPSSLDLNVIIEEIKEYCQSPGARQKLDALRPSADKGEILTELHETNEVLSLLISGDGFPSTEFESIQPSLDALRIKGNALEEKQFGNIRSACKSYENLFRYISNRKERLAYLYLLVAELPPDPEITEKIDQVLDERDIVRSNASPELSRIRTQLVKSRAAANRIFARALKKYRDKGYLADFDESVSENRRVLAIQSSYKNNVNGIFHGSSSKHSIVFIEPGETIEVNNEIALLIDSELQEIRRILRALTAEMRPKADHLRVLEQNLIKLDFNKAKALFGHSQECCLPEIVDKRELILKEAYNPVLKFFNSKKQKATIPLDITLDADQKIIVISGPNAGGKSIALKTIGLLQIMLQSGILIPVDPVSKLGLFDSLHGDIGDHQSIENELSTYSSKLEKMKHFLRYGNEATLLIIDEFGSGSDPELGSSMAQVFLMELHKRGVYGIFTTHYNAIKALAAETKGISNGAMLFNRKTFQPEYKLEVGNPGSSYTFEVAERIGLPKELIEEARNRTASKTLDIDNLLIQIQDEKLQIEKARERLRKELQKLRQLQGDQKVTIRKLEEKLEKQSRLNEENDRIMYWGQRFQKLVEGWMNQESKKDKKEIVSRFIGILNQRSGEVEKEETQNFSKAKQKRNAQLDKLKNEDVEIGDLVQVLDSGLKGTIAEVRKDKYTIVLGGNIRSVLARDQFIKAKAKLEPQPQRKKRKKSFSKGKQAPKKTNPGNKPS